MARIREANGMTEREVLAVGDALKAIVDEARNYVEDSRKTLEEFASTSLTDMLSRHGSVMTEFVDTVTKQVRDQGEAAQQATDQINRIVELGRTIERVTMESKILALNANIQARRLGASGESFQVIAQEMKHFSESVNDANKTVQEIAEGLLHVLPKISMLAANMRKTSEGFSKDINERVAEVAETNSTMKQGVAESMAAGEARLQQILKLSYEALSHLQFQDTVAQSLLGCEAELSFVLKEVDQWRVGGDTGLEEAKPKPLERAADSSTMESGDVMLF
ncbi:MAG: methyl-accepting chemotaxis protein [Polyangiaceae bacterium]